MSNTIQVKYPCRRCDLCITTRGTDVALCSNPIIREQEEGHRPLCVTCGCDKGYPDMFKASDGILHATVNCLECDMILQHKVVDEPESPYISSSGLRHENYDCDGCGKITDKAHAAVWADELVVCLDCQPKKGE